MHYWAWVILHDECPVATPEQVRQSVHEAMAPYGNDVAGPDAIWDWYEIGGRWYGEIIGGSPLTEEHYLDLPRRSPESRILDNAVLTSRIKVERTPFALIYPGGLLLRERYVPPADPESFEIGTFVETPDFEQQVWEQLYKWRSPVDHWLVSVDYHN